MNKRYSLSALSILIVACLQMSSLAAAIPFLPGAEDNNLTNERLSASLTDEIPFLAQMRANAFYENEATLQLAENAMMPCADFVSVGNDTNVCFADTARLVGIAFLGVNRQEGEFFIADPVNNTNEVIFLNTDGTPASSASFGLTFFNNSAANDSILVIRDPASSDPLRTTFDIVYRVNATTCDEVTDTMTVTFDLEPNVGLKIDLGMQSDSLVAGDAGADSFMGTVCNGSSLSYNGQAANQPTTLSGKPVFILAEVTDTADLLGFGGSGTYSFPLSDLDLDTTLANTGREDIFLSATFRPYHETDGNQTDPNLSMYDDGIDPIGDSVQFTLMVLADPLASFSGNDTLCYGDDALLMFTGTANTRVFYSEDSTGFAGFIDLDGTQINDTTFENVTTGGLFFTIDSLIRLIDPFCEAAPMVVSSIAPQSFEVLDSVSGSLTVMDSIVCDTLGGAATDEVAFLFNGSSPTGSYTFSLTNNVSADVLVFENITDGDMLAFSLADSITLFGTSPVAITFYLEDISDLSTRFACSTDGVQDSATVFVEPVPTIKLTFGNGDTLRTDVMSQVLPTVYRDTFCANTSVNTTVENITNSIAGADMFVEMDVTVFNIETSTTVSSVTITGAAASLLNPAGPLVTPFPSDSTLVTYTARPYFEANDDNSYDTAEECAGAQFEIQYLLTPVPDNAQITVAFTTDTVCAGEDAFFDIMGVPNSDVTYDVGNGAETITLDGNGDAQVTVPTMASDSGPVTVQLQLIRTECILPLSASDEVFVKPLPQGTISLIEDELCSGDTAYVIFNTTTTFQDSLFVRFDTIAGSTNAQRVGGFFSDGDTIYAGPLTDDREFTLVRLSYFTNPNGTPNSCIVRPLQVINATVENVPVVTATINDFAGMMTIDNTSPATASLPFCNGDSLGLSFSLPTPADTSVFNDSVFVKVIIDDPLGAFPMTGEFIMDIDEFEDFDTIQLVNNTPDTAFINITAIPFFAPADAMGDPTIAFEDACVGDSIKLTLEVISSFVSTIGGSFEVCEGDDTVVTITGPDFADVTYQAIFLSGGMEMVARTETVTLNGSGEFDIEVDSILSDTIYRLTAASLPPRGCPAQLGADIVVSVIPRPVADFTEMSLMACEGSEVTISLTGPADGRARIIDSLGTDSTFVTFDAMGNATFTLDSLIGDTKFYVDSIFSAPFGSMNASVCITDTITDSIAVIQIAAPVLTLVTDTVCSGDTAYVFLAADNPATAFDLTVMYDGNTTMVDTVSDGDTVLVIPDLTMDNAQVILVAAVDTNVAGGACPALPTQGNLDTAILRVDPLPTTTITVTQPVSEVIDDANDMVTITACVGDPIDFDIAFSQLASLGGDTTMLSFEVLGSNISAVPNGFSGSVFSDDFNSIVVPSAFDGMGTTSGPRSFDSLEVRFVTYYETDMMPQSILQTIMSTPSTLDADECSGDTLTLKIIVNPTPGASFAFAQDTICEGDSTSVLITSNQGMGGAGDVVSFAIEGTTFTNQVLDSNGEFTISLPPTTDFPASVTEDSMIVFAIASVTSNTTPGCTNSTFLTDTLHIEPLPTFTVSIADTTVCDGDMAMVDFTGDPGDTIFFTVEVASTTPTSNFEIVEINGTTSPFTPTITEDLTITIDSVVSGSPRACAIYPDSTLATIMVVTLPEASLTVDTTCTGDAAVAVFNYAGNRVLGMMDSFDITYDSVGSTVTARVVDGDTIGSHTTSGSFAYQITSITDLATTCTNSIDVRDTVIVDDTPQLSIDFTGAIFNGTSFDTENPPNPFFPPTFEGCSGSQLTFMGSSMTATSAAGDSLYVRIDISGDPFGVFGGAASPIYVALADFNFSQLLTNMSATTQNLTFSVTPYFETTPGMGATQDMDECEGGTINFTVRIRPEPQAEFANMDTMRVCSGEMVNIMFTGSVGVVVDFADDDSNPYTATVGGAPVVYNATTTTTPDTVRFGITQLTQTYPFVTCTAMPTDSFVLIINPLPAPSISTNATGNAICNGDMIDIIFTDAVGEGPWNVTLNGTPYNVANSGDVIGTFGPLTADSAFVLTSVTDANGCSAPLAAMQTFVDSLSVLVDDIPDLTSVVTINDLIGGMVTNTDLNSGLLDTTVCALSDISIAGSTTTPMSNNGDPLYVQLTFMDDQPGGVWPSYDSMTELFVPVADLETALDALPTNTGSTAFTGSVIMTPYFETNTSVPSLDMGECVGLADTFRVTVSPRPNANPTSFAETICSGDEFTFDLAGVITNFVAGTTFTYTTSSTSANTTADPRTMGSADGIADTLINLATVANGNSSQTVTYVVTPMAPGGCVGGTFTIDVEVLPAPVLDTNDGDQICSGDDLGIQMTFVQNIPGTNQFELISVTNDAMGTGFMADAGNRMVGDTFNLNIIRDDSYENRTDDTVTVAYTFVPMSSNGCNGDTATYEVRIIPEPRVEDITISVCSGTRLDIDIFQDLVANMVGDTAIFFRSSAFAEPINVFNEDGDQVCNATFGCEPQMGPPGLIVGRRGSFIRDSVINTGTATSQIIYDVYVNDSDNYCANDVAIPGPPRFIENGPNGLGTAFTMANRFTLTVNILREASVTLSASATEFCSGDPITLTPNFTNGNGSPSFTYSVLSMDAGVDTITFDTSGTGNSVIVDGAGAGVATILVEASDEFGCFATNTIDITVGDTPEDRVIEGFEEPCAGSILSPYRLEPGADPGNFYEWSLSDPTAGAFFGISSGFGLSSVVISWNSAGGPFTLTCVETSPSGCTNTHSLDINVVQNSAADFSFTVNPNNTLEVLFFEAAQGDVVEYNWDFGDGMGTSTDEDPVYTYAMAGTYNVTLTTRSLCGGQTFDMVTKPVTVGGAVACQTISLQPGLNFVSLNVIPADSSITALFGATPEVVQINGWQSGAPNLWERSAGGFNSLNEFNRGFGYLVSATAAVDVIICGTPETGTYRRPLDQGVNYIGTTLTADVAADTYFATLNTNMDLALAYIIENGAVRLYDPGAGGFNDLTTLEAGKAYIIVMNSAVAGGSYRASTSEEHEFIYGIVSGNGLVNGEPVEVVNANGEVVASFMPDATGLYKATPIFGALSRQDGSFADGLNYGEAYYFRHNGITVDAGMSYNGSYRATRLDFNFETSVEADAVDAITVSPNPIAAMTKVDLAFSVADRYEVKVLDVTGRTVSTLTNAYQEVGNMSFNWNTSQLSAGVYTIVVLRDGALLPSLTTRVIK